MELKITIPGRQLTKKRHYRRGRGSRFYLSKEYKAYEKAALQWLWQWLNVHVPGPVHVQAIYYPPDKRHGDLDNYEATWGDILQAAGLIENDKLIKSWDGSRIMEPRKDRPEVEITIRSLE